MPNPPQKVRQSEGKAGKRQTVISGTALTPGAFAARALLRRPPGAAARLSTRSPGPLYTPSLNPLKSSNASE